MVWWREGGGGGRGGGGTSYGCDSRLWGLELRK